MSNSTSESPAVDASSFNVSSEAVIRKVVRDSSMEYPGYQGAVLMLKEPKALTGDERTNIMINLMKIKDELDAALKLVDKHIGEFMEPTIDHFTEQGQQKVTRFGRTLYLAKEEWPKLLSEVPDGVDDDTRSQLESEAKAELIDALKSDPSTAFMVGENYNTQTLRSYLLTDCRDEKTDDIVIPEHLKKRLGVSTKFKLKAVKAGK